MALAERDVRLALGIVEAAAATQNGTPFGTELLDALLEAIPAVNVEYMEWKFHEAPSFGIARPSYPLRETIHFASVEPLRITDLVSTRAFRKTACYAIMRPFGVEHELKL